MMTRGTKEFIREHLDLIDVNEWDKFYDIVSLNENFQLLYQIGEVTTFLKVIITIKLIYPTVYYII